MNPAGHQAWLRTAIFVGLVYFLIGMVFGAFAGWSASNRMLVTWRLLSFFTSAVVFAIHIGYEKFRLQNSAVVTALHTSIAVAVGAFGIAVAANVHGQLVDSSNQRLLLLALVTFPAVTAIPAFLVALIVAAGLGLTRRNR